MRHTLIDLRHSLLTTGRMKENDYFWFGTKNPTERYKLEMRNRRKMKGESMHDLFIDMKRLVTLAFPDLTEKAVDSVGVEAFAHALADEQMRKAVMMARSKTMEEVADLAVHFEVLELGQPMDASFSGNGRKKE